MTLLSLIRLASLVFVVLFVGVCLIWPLVRLRRRTGKWGLIVQRRTGLQRLVGVLFSALIAGAVAWAGLVLACEPAVIALRLAPPAVHAVGAALTLAGLAVVALAQAQMGASWRIGIDENPTDLVERGLYAYSRHPIYSGVLIALVGTAVLTPSPWTAAGAVLAVLTLSLQARLEEKHLIAQHGEAYQAYAGRVGRFLPGIGRL